MNRHDGYFALLCFADALGRQAAAMRGERYESKLEAWLKSANPLCPNPCTPSGLPDATCRLGEP